MKKSLLYNTESEELITIKIISNAFSIGLEPSSSCKLIYLPLLDLLDQYGDEKIDHDRR